jgi:hypothetical protein
MTRPRFFPSCATFAALALALASTARAQDDTPKLAERAEALRAELQKELAAGSDAEKRLRLEKFEAGDGNLKVTGTFLAPRSANDKEQPEFDAMQAALKKRLETKLSAKGLNLALSVPLVSANKHPHVVLQQAANAAGATAPVADQFRFDSSYYGPTGALVVSGLRGPDAAGAKWLAGELAKLGAANGVALKGGKPDVTDALKEVEWKIGAAAVQKVLAARPEAAARRLRAERAYFAYPTDETGTVDTRELRLVVRGVRLGKDPFDVALLNGPLQQLWPDALDVKRLTFDLIRTPPADEPVAQFRAEVAQTVALTGVRVDAGAEFDADGVLTFKGARPKLGAAETRELAAAWQRALAGLVAKGDDAAKEYARIAAVPVSAARMQELRFDLVLAEARALAASRMDDALVSRLYFNADGALRLKVRTVKGTDHAALLDAAFKKAQDDHLAKLPPIEGQAAALEPDLFERSFTARLREVMARDQQKWNGVLIERGFFDADGKYTIRGVVDDGAQNGALDAELKAIADSNAAYKPFYYAPDKGGAEGARTANKPALDVIPMKGLVDRTKRVTPAYEAFDGVRVLGARYDANTNLVFDAHVVGRLDPTAASLLAQLLRDHPDFKRRTPADRLVKIAPVTANPADEQLADFGLAYGAKLLAKPNPSATDKEKARAWLEASRLHYPNEAGVWFLSAYYHHTTGDAELARRDMFRVVELEGPLSFNGPIQRKRRSDAAKDLQGTARVELDALWLDAFRATKDGERPITMVERK